MQLDKELRQLKKELASQTKKYSEIYTPTFFRILNPEDQSSLLNLLKEKPHIQVFDSINNQLTDLVKGLNPTLVLTKSEIDELIVKRLNGIESDAYGVWVYYPWLEKLVHILDKEEFILVRTNRNKHKITQQEQDQLMEKKIGVIGLSVGQSVSLTLAIERGCGELRIADFDHLDLTNLNRIRSGVQNVDLRKTVIVAREIAEIDPFLKVTCFHEGITEENIESFLTENGKLDLLIDECDGIDIKILCRVKAKAHQIPVLMEASDRGTIDIERFDLEPNRPILHGYIEHLDISKVKHLKTNEEKIPYILPIAGVETLSTRMKASMIEIQQTITSWPQLASAVTYGGGITADLSRRILLQELSVSGRFFVDIEEIIADPVDHSANAEIPQPEKGITFPEMDTLTAQLKLTKPENSIQLNDEQLESLMLTAQRGSSAGNNQPWKWLYKDGALLLFHDKERSFSFANHKNIVAYVGFGLTLESIRLKADSLNLQVHEQLFPDSQVPELIAVLQFSQVSNGHQKDGLADFTGLRNTNRNQPKEIRSIPAEALAEIKAETEQIDGAKIYFIEDKNDILQVANIMGEADKLRLYTPTGHHELFNLELRFTKEDSERTGDGLDLESFGLTAGEAIGMRIAKDPKVLDLLKSWKMGTGLERLSKKSGLASSAIALVTMPGYTSDDFIRGGKAVERMWLTANRAGVSVHPMTASILHFNILKYGDGLNQDLYLKDKFSELNEIFYNSFSAVNQQEVSVFLCRLFYAEEAATPSKRLPIDKIFMSNLTQ
ncbi:Rv1355c family protein [Pedobacter gandavensis]|uniref:Rv1355c family protein n=1 Tax=Pedobacter gandavensis TaxID=2679963 RepID=UPI00292D40F8|nr:Rv1355c family protein [Pedobacter gandavensis]